MRHPALDDERRVAVTDPSLVHPDQQGFEFHRGG
jgi:hypothetical protein